jgi:tRNA dimethylallyltransferase
MRSKLLVIIAGPTAIGKTSLSIELANQYNCPIISFDSRQIYAEMSIGTAKPTETELNQAEHHFIGSHSIHKRYTAGMYETEALAKLDEIFKSHDMCIAVGGSGLYIDALIYGIDDIPADENIREKLKAEWQENGLDLLQERVKKIDPEYYALGDMQNSRRVIRALEVHELTGKTYTELRKKTPKKRPFESLWIGLNMEREKLFERINKRVDIMVQDGLIEEVETLLPWQDLKALKTVGYSELFDYFNNIIPQEKAIELIKRNTRHFSKRQVTWFAKNQDVNWYEPSQKEQIIDKINQNFIR